MQSTAKNENENVENERYSHAKMESYYKGY